MNRQKALHSTRHREREIFETPRPEALRRLNAMKQMLATSGRQHRSSATAEAADSFLDSPDRVPEE